MPREQVNQLVNLGIPYRGMNSDLPIVGLSPEFSAFELNTIFKNGIIQNRAGIKVEEAQPRESVGAIVNKVDDLSQIAVFSAQVDTSAPDNTFAVDTFDISGSGTTEVAPSFTDGTTPISTLVTTCDFSGRTFAFRMDSTPGQFNGSTFVVAGFSGGSMRHAIGATNYNSRMYVIQAYNSAASPGKVYYSATAGGISGAFTLYDVQLLTNSNDEVTNIFTFTLSSGLQSEQLLGMVTDKGTVLIFSGANPADASWALIGRFQISAPTGIQSWVNVNGDVLLITEQGIVSIRALVQNTNNFSTGTFITQGISRYWAELIRQIKLTDTTGIFSPRQSNKQFIRATFDQTENRVLIYFPTFLVPSETQVGYTPRGGGADANSILQLQLDTQSWRVLSTPYPVLPAGFAGLHYHNPTAKVCFGRRRFTAFSPDQFIYSLREGVSYADERDDSGDLYNYESSIYSGAFFNSKVQRVSGVQILLGGDSEWKDILRVGVRGNLSGAYSETSQALADGTSLQLYNVGNSSHFTETKISTPFNTAELASAPTLPLQIGNISLLTQTGGIL
jgi:hypothetical protein